jgi:MYXO-CTERM domain-containing protein
MSTTSESPHERMQNSEGPGGLPAGAAGVAGLLVAALRRQAGCRRHEVGVQSLAGRNA